MQGQIPVAVCGRARSLPVSPLVLCVEEAVRGPAGAGAGTGSRLTGWEQAPEDTTSSRGGNGRSSRAVARASGRRQARRAHPRTGTGTRRRSSSRRAGGRPSHCAKAEPPYGSNPTLPHARRTVLPHRQWSSHSTSPRPHHLHFFLSFRGWLTSGVSLAPTLGFTNTPLNPWRLC